MAPTLKQGLRLRKVPESFSRPQPIPHTPFHALPAILAKHTDPSVTSAVALDTAIKGMATPQAIRASKNLTGAHWAGGDGVIKAPDITRGFDDGYDSDTERGTIARRHNVGREQLKETLTYLRSESPAAAKLTAPPSPGRSRGGMGPRGARDPFEPPALKKQKLKESEDAASITQFAFAGYQTLTT